MTARALERSLVPLDALRARTFRFVLASTRRSPWVVRRDRRLASLAALHAAVAFALAVYYPVLLFVLGPVLFGVAHVAADVRYLVLRRRLEGWWRGVVVGACAGFVLLAVAVLFGWLPPSERLEFGLLALWAVTGVVAAVAQSRAWARGALGLTLALLLGGVALRWPWAFRLGFIHAHNLVPLAIWPLFYRVRLKLLGRVRVAIVGAALVLASGVAYRASLASPGAEQFGLHVLALSEWVAPVPRADWAVGITSAFVFLQAVHYSIWLSIIPQAAMSGEGTLSFRQSARSLRADFGTRGVALVLGCIAAVMLLAVVNAPRASATYLRLAMFHGYLELVLLLYFWIARQPLADFRARAGVGRE